jgi:carbonic anhydrase
MILPLVFLLSSAHGYSVPGADWSYDEASGRGPSVWGTLAPEFHLCGDGTQQSPININKAAAGGLPDIGFHYRETPLIIENNGHTIEVPYAPNSKITIGGNSYRLVQFHFHTPSEHSVLGQSFPMEAHLVHMRSSGQLAVVGVLLKAGKANPLIEEVLSQAPEEEGEVEVEGHHVNAENLLPRSRRYATYAGSLTTPPCSEGVQWFVMQEPVDISAQQAHRLQELLDGVAHFPFNARPLQPLNGRSVTAGGR